MRLGIASAVTSALFGFICAAIPLAAADAQAPAKGAAPAAPALQQIQLTNSIDLTGGQTFEAKFKAPKTPDPNAAAEGMSAAPAMIASAGVQCTPTEARLIGSVDSTDKGQKSTYKAVETTCKEGLGLILLQINDKTTAADCLSSKFRVGERASTLVCTLPANNNAPTAFQPILTKANSPCVPANAAYIGETATVLGYEIQCQAGNGEVVQITKPRTPASAVVSGSCAALPRAEGQPFPCKLTTEEANLAPIKRLASQATPPCTASKVRYLTRDSDGSEYYEAACTGGAGVVIHASNKGTVINTLTCGQAGGLGGGCTLTDAKASVAEATSDYTAKAKAAGFDCSVTKFTVIPAKTPDTQAVDLACNGGNGGVLFTKAGKSTVFNCGRSQAEGIACGLTDSKLALTAITNQLKELGRTTCDVSAIRPLASATSAYVEVACADKAPGYMLKYPRDSNTPSNAYTCNEAKLISGGCTLPTNKAS